MKRFINDDCFKFKLADEKVTSEVKKNVTCLFIIYIYGIHDFSLTVRRAI